MACTVDTQTWAPHRRSNSLYSPHGLTPSPTRSHRSASVQSSREEKSPTARVTIGARCQSCGDDSVLVKPSQVDRCVHPPSILKSPDSPATSRRKRIGFKNEALVIHLSQGGDYLYSDLENVNFEPKSCNLHHKLARMAKLHRANALADSTGKYAAPQQTRTDQSPMTPDVTSQKDIRMSYTRDPLGVLSMHMTLYVGREFSPRDILVKACTSGSKVRVMSVESQQSPSYIRDITLPIEIESMTLKAKMDSKGYLSLEGHLKEVDQYGTL